MKNRTDEKTLSAKQLLVLDGLALNPDIETVAQNVGVSKSTIYEWMKQKSFRDRLVEKRTEILDESVDQIKTYCRTALRKIADLMNSESEPISLKAAQYLLDKALETKMVQEFEQRIKTLEEQLKKGENENGDINQAQFRIKSA